jgi:hypothetical protein
LLHLVEDLKSDFTASGSSRHDSGNLTLRGAFLRQSRQGAGLDRSSQVGACARIPARCRGFGLKRVNSRREGPSWCILAVGLRDPYDSLTAMIRQGSPNRKEGRRAGR